MQASRTADKTIFIGIPLCDRAWLSRAPALLTMTAGVQVKKILTERCVVPRLLVVPHGRWLEVSGAGLQVPLHLVLIQRNSQTGRIRNFDVALVDDGLFDSGD